MNDLVPYRSGVLTECENTVTEKPELRECPAWWFLKVLKLIGPPGRLMTVSNAGDADKIAKRTAQIKIAMDMKAMGLGFCLRAIVEEWDRERIVMELY